MKQILLRVYNILLIFGFDPLKTILSIRGLPAYFRDLKTFLNQYHSGNGFPLGSYYPCLNERFEDNGSTKSHYFHQDLLVARRVYLNNPHHHVDAGSKIESFVAHVASFREIEVIDIRPLSSNIPNVTFKQVDLMSPLPENSLEYCDSLSCLHALEHFGLGRYGDPVRYDGHILGLDNLYRMLKKGGKLYFSVPIGSQRIEFNAHRVFSVEYLLKYFERKYHLDHFSFIDDLCDLHENTPVTDSDAKNNFGCAYGCGIFELTKL